PQLACGDPLRLKRTLALVAEPLCLFVQLRVLDRDRELRRERAHECRLVLRQRSPERWIRGEQADCVLADEQGQRDDGLDPRLGCRAADRREARIDGDVRDRDQAAPSERPEEQLEQAVGEANMWPCETVPGGGIQAPLLTEVDG